MKLKISQRPDEFFDLFTLTSKNLREGSELLADLIHDYRDLDLKVKRIQEREHEGDELTHRIIRQLNTSFITPIDREDIYELATALDDVMDAIEGAADLFELHAIASPLPQMSAQVDLLVRATKETELALTDLRRMDRDRLQPYWIAINTIENEGDQLFRHGLAELFSGEHDAMDVLRWKEVLEVLEEALDQLENVGNIIESIVLKHA